MQEMCSICGKETESFRPCSQCGLYFCREGCGDSYTCADCSDEKMSVFDYEDI